MRSMERSARMADRDPTHNRGDYYTLIVSLALFFFCVFVSSTVLRAPITEFFVAIEKTIANLGGGPPVIPDKAVARDPESRGQKAGFPLP
jgi:hypothetical protein